MTLTIKFRELYNIFNIQILVAIFLITFSNLLLAREKETKINSLMCQVVDSTTRTFEIGDGTLKNYGWMGNPKKDGQLNIDFKIIASGCMIVDFNASPLIGLYHSIDFENKEVHPQNNWIKSNDTLFKSSQLTLYRNGMRITSNTNRSSVDIRKRTTRNWDGHIVVDMRDNDYNSLQLISLNCKLSQSWDYLMDFVINKKSCQN